MKNVLIILFIIFFSSTKSTLIAKETNLTIPRFVSLKSNDSNLRVGPNEDYPKILNYKVANFPLEIIEEFDRWRKTIDFQGNVGWIYVPLLKNERFAIIVAPYEASVQVYNKPKGIVIGKIGRDNVIKLNRCLEDWCHIKIKNNKGWINKINLWGVYKNETFNIPFYQIILDQFWKFDINF